MNRRDVTVGGLACFAVAATAGSKVVEGHGRRRSPQVLRLSRTLVEQSANLRDYCTANGRAVDTQSYQELIALGPSTINYPADTVLVIDKTVQLRPNQTHMFAPGARISAEVADYAMVGTGRTTGSLASLAHWIPRYSKTIFLDRVPDIGAGHLVLLADITDPENLKLDINEVERLEGGAVTVRYPIGRPFSNPKNFRIYRVFEPLHNLRMFGPVRCANAHRSGGFLRLTNALDVHIRGLTIEDAGYIGLNFESSLRGRFEDIAIEGAGASGFGLRASKDIIIDGFKAQNVRADESLTFYDNVSHADVQNISIEQYAYSERNGREAGNNILIDKLCSKIRMRSVYCIGSTTYNVMLNGESEDCSISEFSLSRSNLGGIRVSAGCKNIRIGKGMISDVLDAVDQESGKPATAITIGSSCSGVSISNSISYQRISTGLRLGTFRG